MAFIDADNAFAASLIALLVVGGVLFISFCLWEWKVASHPIMPKRVFNRTFVNQFPHFLSSVHIIDVMFLLGLLFAYRLELLSFVSKKPDITIPEGWNIS